MASEPVRTLRSATAGSYAAAADVKTLRSELSSADDEKIRRVAMLVESTDDPNLNRALLDPVRVRLAPLRPPRALRLPRLLFIPFDPLIVPARNWKSDDATIPRSALMPLSRVVEAALGTDEAAIGRVIAGTDDSRVEVVAEAGAGLWARAAEIMDAARAPSNWAHDSGLPDAVFEPLVRAMATVWRRAPKLRVLFRTGQIGALRAEPEAVDAIMTGTPAESALGCAMVARLILLQSPFAAKYVRLFANSSINRGDKVVLQKAIASGVDEVIRDLEHPQAFAETIEHAPADRAGDHLRNVITLLLQIEDDGSSRISGPRLKTVRDNLSKACRTRFADGMKADVLGPLAAAAQLLEAADQTRIEAAARDLRMVEAAARPLGGAADYDALLDTGTLVVEEARKRGALTRVGEIRLTEILGGPEAALRLYRQ